MGSKSKRQPSDDVEQQQTEDTEAVGTSIGPTDGSIPAKHRFILIAALVIAVAVVLGITAALTKESTATSLQRKSCTLADAEISLFSKDILQGYASREELELDLTCAAMHLVNVTITRKLEQLAASDGVLPSTIPQLPIVPARPAEDIFLVPLNYSSGDPPKLKKQYPKEESTKPKSFNNRNGGSERVDEADMVQRDDNFVYAAYGDYLVVWDQVGKLVTQVKIPSEGLVNNANDSPTTNSTANCASDNFLCFFELAASIRAILLTPDQVLVVVESDDDSSSNYYYKEGNVLSDADKPTRLYLYSKPTRNGSSYAMSLLHTKDITGRYSDGLYMPHSNTIHLVTEQNIYFSESLAAPFSLDNFPESISYDDYQKEATSLALDRVIPKFVQSLSNEILSEDGSTPNMIRINSWKTTKNPSGTQGSTAYSALDGYIQIHSISVPISETTKMEISRSALLTPSRGHAVYGKDNFLVFVTHDDVWNVTADRHFPTTCFLTLKTLPNTGDNNVDDDGKTMFHSIAALPGYYMPSRESIITKNRMDIQGNDLRYAVGRSVRIFNLDHQGDMTADADSIRQIEIGVPGERISSIEFGTQGTTGLQSAHVMTFDDDLQSGFLYVVDLARLEVLSSLRLPDVHFTSLQLFNSSYTEAGQNAASLLLGIGKKVSTATSQGLLVTIFDVSDSSSPPRFLAKHSVQRNQSGWTAYSLAQEDPKAADHINGKLALPYNMADIDGVVVLDLGNIVAMGITGTIPELYRYENPGRLLVGAHYYCTRSLPGPRSFLQEGGSTLTTISANSLVIGTNVNTGTGQQLWSLNVTFPDEPLGCVARTCDCNSNHAVL